jgi:hypothetical protein
VAITADLFGSKALNAREYILKAKTVDEAPGPPPVAVYTMSNTLSSHNKDMDTTVIVTGFNDGTVI